MEMFTWEYLASAAGAAAAVAILTQFAKYVPFLNKAPTQLVSYVISVVVMLAASFFTGALTADSAALIPLNAVVVMLAANGAYDTLSKKKAITNANQ